MNRNVEIKAQLTESQFEQARQAASQLASSAPQQLIQTDTFFNCTHGRLKLRQFGDGSGELIFYQRPDAGGAKTSDYLRSPIENHEALRDVLAGSLGIRGVVRKKRILYLVQQTRIHLDEVESLGKFLELEVVLAATDSVFDGEQIIKQLLGQLGITSGQLVAGAYMDLLNNR